MSEVKYLGTDYGGWGIELDHIRKPSNVITGGIGKDASMEEELLTMFNCRIEGFDPTPGCTQINFRRWEIGLSGTNGDCKFYHHNNPEYQTAHYKQEGEWGNGRPIVSATLWTIKTAIERLGLSRIDYLKLCLGGDTEASVIKSMLDDEIYPKQLSYLYLHWNQDSIIATRERLDNLGYKVVWLDENKKRVTLCKE